MRSWVFNGLRGICVAALLVCAAASAWGQTYVAVDLGTLGGVATYGATTVANGINNWGQVVGSSYTASGQQHAFLYSPPFPPNTSGSMIDLGTLGGATSVAYGVNDSGQVVGWSYTASGQAHAFLYSPPVPPNTSGSMIDLGTLGGTTSAANGINDSGQVVGWSYTAKGQQHAFLCSPAVPPNTSGSMIDLGTLPVPLDGDSLALGINNSGQVVGHSGDGNPSSHAFLDGGVGMADLGPLPGFPVKQYSYSSSANGINNSGQVVGWAGSADGSAHAFLYTGGSMIDLGLLPGSSRTVAQGINNSGQVVGWADCAVYAPDISCGSLFYHAFLYSPPVPPNSGGTMTDLNNLVSAPYPLYSATGINDLGEIAANGGYSAYLLTTACSAAVKNAVSLSSLAVLPLPGSEATTMVASFTPNSGLSLQGAATLCGFSNFNWVQLVTNLPTPSPYCQNASGAGSSPCPGINFPAGVNLPSVSTPLPFNDPVEGGYTYMTAPEWVGWNGFPFYWDNVIPGGSGVVGNRWTCGVSGIVSEYPCWTLLANESAFTLSFYDTPGDPCLPGGNPALQSTYCRGSQSPVQSYLGFSTSLVGVPLSGAPPIVLFGWTWSSTFNGTSGGIPTITSLHPVDPGSGTGGITVTSVNHVRLSTQSPVLTAPANGATSVATTPTLNWSAATGAASYDVYFGTSSPPPMVKNVSATSYAPAALSAGTTYYWHIVARYSNVTMDSGPPWSFTTAGSTVGSAPGVPALTSPTNGAQGVPTLATLSWGAATSASAYNVYLGTSTPPPQVTNTTGNSYAPAPMNPGTTYYWSVTAQNSFGSTASAIWSFTTGAIPQTITFGALSNVTYGIAPFTIGATASSGLPVSFASTTAPVCTVSGSTATIVAVGGCSITVSQAGNANYAAAAPVTQSFTVTPAFFAGSVNGGGGTLYLQFPNGKTFGYYVFLGGGWMFHVDLGYVYVAPGNGPEVYLWDMSSGHWWYTNTGTFPYLYDFTLNAWIYYFPDTKNGGHYTTNPRYFVNMTTGQIFAM